MPDKVKLTKDRWHNGAESREMGRVEGWVVVRRKGAAPYLIHGREWDALPSAEDGKRWSDAYASALNTPPVGLGKMGGET